MEPFFTPYYGGYTVQNMTAYVRILHAAPNAPSVDVYANNALIAQNLGYQQFTEYLPITAGRYRIDVYPAGRTVNPVITQELNVPAQTIYTVAAIESTSGLTLLPVLDPVLPPPGDMVMVRFAHLSPNAPAVDITLPNGQRIFQDISYREITNYTSVSPGIYTLEVRITGTEKTVLYVPNISLKPNRFYTVYAVGLVGDSPPLQALIPLDGNSYIQF